MKTLILIIVAVLIQSCAKPKYADYTELKNKCGQSVVFKWNKPQVAYFIDKSALNKLERINAAFKEINDAVGYELVIISTIEKYNIIKVSQYDNNGEFMKPTLNGRTHNEYQFGQIQGSVIVLNPNMVNEFKTIVIHEVLHNLGLNHLNKTIMTAMYMTTRELFIDDVTSEILKCMYAR